MSGYDNIKMSCIAYLAVLGSEGYSIYDMAYYPCPVYDNYNAVYVILILIFTCHQKVRIWEHIFKIWNYNPKTRHDLDLTAQCKNLKLQVCIMIYIYASHHRASISCIWRYNFRIWHYFVKITFCIVGIYHTRSTYAKMLSHSQCGTMS